MLAFVWNCWYQSQKQDKQSRLWPKEHNKVNVKKVSGKESIDTENDDGKINTALSHAICNIAKLK